MRIGCICLAVGSVAIVKLTQRVANLVFRTERPEALDLADSYCRRRDDSVHGHSHIKLGFHLSRTCTAGATTKSGFTPTEQRHARTDQTLLNPDTPFFVGHGTSLLLAGQRSRAPNRRGCAFPVARNKSEQDRS